MENKLYTYMGVQDWLYTLYMEEKLKENEQ